MYTNVYDDRGVHGVVAVIWSTMFVQDEIPVDPAVYPMVKVLLKKINIFKQIVFFNQFKANIKIHFNDSYLKICSNIILSA